MNIWKKGKFIKDKSTDKETYIKNENVNEKIYLTIPHI